MKNSSKALIFIPDISGFTHFVNNTEINHARHIIEELLEVLIDANQTDLQLSEIEGDALLFCRPGEAPTCTTLLDQIKRMYIDFHAHLKKYDKYRICSCGACCEATHLQLKFVAHFGEVVDKKVKDRTKLFGKDVIVAHRLLKNTVASDEYGLFSTGLLDACPSWKKLDDLAWSEVIQEEEEYDFGTARYSVIQLESLRKEVPEPKPKDFSIPGASEQIFASEGIIEAPLDLTFDVVTDYNFREKFMFQQIGGDQKNHEIFQNGSVHRCIVDGKQGNPVFVAHDFSFSPQTLTFVESDHQNGFSVVWTLTALNPSTTRVEMANFIKPNFIKRWMFNLFFKKKFTNGLANSWHLLNDYCKQLVSEGKQHPNRMVLPEGVV